MPFYTDLRGSQDPSAQDAFAKEGRLRTIARLLDLRQASATQEGSPPPRSFGTLLLASSRSCAAPCA
jgi:hypothetical protein